MRAWEPCTVSMLASVLHPARSFVPASSFRFAPLALRSVRRPLYSHVCNRCDGSSGSGLRQGLLGLSRRRALWAIQNAVSVDIRMRGGSMRLIRTSSSSGAVDSIQVDDRVRKEWSVSKDFRSSAGGPSVVNAVGAQLGNLINSGLTRWRKTVLMETVAESGRQEWSPVRQTFIDYFQSKHGHTPFPSSPVVPVNDPTLLFANAGMNQFKPIFLGQTDPTSPLAALRRAVNSQKCIRAGGKHNDLEDVGKDVYHHTLFEMLGTWSFGDYFKEEAVEWSWDALTEGAFNLPSDRLYATYFGGDEALGLSPDLETRDLWLKFLPPERVLPGDRKDNFWEMGDVGPCGPCSELHFDRIGGRDASKLVNMDDPDVIEIWNLVFMQFNRDESGTLKLLPSKHVDTGMGLERLVSVLQDKRSNYDTDIFEPLFDAIREVTGCSRYEGRVGEDDADLQDTAYRVVADHARALCFAIADGAVPSNEGRGYVLRRILRRAVRYGQEILKAPSGFFHKIVPVVVSTFGEAYPELRDKEAFVMEVVKDEEEAFGSMLERGIKHFKEVKAEQREKSASVIPGSTAFFLYDSMGFPLDLTQIMAEEVGMTVDEEGFQAEMASQKARSKEAAAARRAAEAGVQAMALGAEETAQLASDGIKPTDDDAKYTWSSTIGSKVVAMFDGETLSTPSSESGATVTVSVESSDEEAQSSPPTTVGVVLDATPFYAEGGGQVADCGRLTVTTESKGTLMKGVIEVVDVRMFGGYALHVGRLVSGSLSAGDTVRCEVDYDRRKEVAPNHTMTHVLNFALKKVLGDDVEQKGSLVTDEKLRFDFSNGKALTGPQLDESERIVQDFIAEGREVFNKVVPLNVAKSISGLRTVFGEVYPDPVRVVSVGFPVEEMAKDPSLDEWGTSSVELCGGTHVSNTKEAEAFVITEETAVAKGVRRITAITGASAKRAMADGDVLQARAEEVSALSGTDLQAAVPAFRRDVDAATLSAGVKGRLRAQGDKLLKRIASEKKTAAAAAAQKGVNAAVKAAKAAAEGGQAFLVLEVMIGADSKAVKRVLDGISKAAPGLSFMGFSAEGPGASGKLLVFNNVVGVAAENGLKADEWLRASLEACGGRGGGRATSAQGQAADAADMEKGMAAAKAFVETS